ncbi:hypothetical protein N7539_009214 [Penicillium diatomitis]|uniref:Uncharacterized protein n=1 Tax=Penicillium diatomitis TaxID=2819901 RepID=A0A9X0BJH1_9EURO|nr:uncharacterized protein N7539_009214 [Penicillium diatomitis]KAJ5469596.1 hypothetical protein N7539_009214 [Penicillium diatomitis]
MDNNLSPRYTTCTGSKQWYVCSAGNYRGCCSTDPCTTGICPDDSQGAVSSANASTSSSLSSSTSTANTSTRTSTRTSSSSSSSLGSDTSTSFPTVTQSPTSSSSFTSSISSALSKTTTTSAETSQAPTLASSPSPAAVSSPSSQQSSSKAPIIGGVLGAIVALILALLLCWCCWRKKRKSGRPYGDFTWRSLRKRSSSHQNGSSSGLKTELSLIEKRAGQSLDGSLQGYQRTSPSSSSNSNEQDHYSTDNSITGSGTPAPSVSINSSALSTLSSGFLTTSSGGLVHVQAQQRVPPPLSEMPGTIPRIDPPAAELSDTGFYRQRAELPAQSQRELINLPPESRRRGGSPLAPGLSRIVPMSSSIRSPGFENPPGQAADDTVNARLNHRQTARKVVTHEGIVLGSNLQQYSPVVRSESPRLLRTQSSSAGRHVMSFMTFGAESSNATTATVPARVQAQAPAQTVQLAAAESPRQGGRRKDPQASRGILESHAEENDDLGEEAPPAYQAGQMSPRREEKSPSGTSMRQ